jgi:hypothetical protein
LQFYDAAIGCNDGREELLFYEFQGENQEQYWILRSLTMVENKPDY